MSMTLDALSSYGRFGQLLRNQRQHQSRSPCLARGHEGWYFSTSRRCLFHAIGRFVSKK